MEMAKGTNGGTSSNPSITAAQEESRLARIIQEQQRQINQLSDQMRQCTDLIHRQAGCVQKFGGQVGKIEDFLVSKFPDLGDGSTPPVLIGCGRCLSCLQGGKCFDGTLLKEDTRATQNLSAYYSFRAGMRR